MVSAYNSKNLIKYRFYFFTTWIRIKKPILVKYKKQSLSERVVDDIYKLAVSMVGSGL